MTEEKAVVTTGTRLSPVWILPIVALLLGIWAVVYSLTQQGPEIEILFDTASGLVEGKTSVKYLDVEVGQVENIRFTRDREAVVATVKMDLDAEDLLREDTRFWVVTAQLGGGTVSGLDTLLSGAYIQLAPGTGESGARDFVALDTPPVTPPGAPGMHLELYTDESPTLGPGDPVLFQGFKVGRVETADFDPEREEIRYRLFVDAPYHELIDSAVRFWDVSGVSLSVDASGLEVSMGSLESILLGGVAFGVPPGMAQGIPVEPGSEFRLYSSYSNILDDPYRYGVHYVVEFNQSLRGLSAGAPVEYRGIRLGYVKRIMMRELMGLRPSGSGDPIPVLIYVEPGRLDAGDNSTGNLITGSMYIEFDYYPDEPAAELGSFQEYTTIPTISGGLSRIEHQVSALLAKVNGLPLEDTVTGINQTMGELNATLASLRGILEHNNTQMLTTELQATLVELRTVLAGLSPDSQAYQSLNASLLELNRTLQNLSDFSRTLSDQPNSLVMPVDNPPDPIPEARSR
jgi:paraquat-inducible protein B